MQADRRLDNAQDLPPTNISVEIPSLSNCTSADDTELALNSAEPVVVIVHGCFASAGQFRSLADVFAFHGQQTICFNYDDRDSLDKSSAELVTAMEELSNVMDNRDITIIGHSQGGLVSRRAFVDRPDGFDAGEVRINLATVSAPFGGIEAAAHCGSKLLAWLSLGLTKPVCRLITGAKYKEIPPSAQFINEPGTLLSVVDRHLKISTDELGTCRRYGEDGGCAESDFVFSLKEQTQPAISADPGLADVTVRAGHVEIVGDGDTTPTKLIEILQAQRMLSQTPPERRAALSELLAALYLSD